MNPDRSGISRQDVLAAVSRAFPRTDTKAILELLDTYGSESHHRERERVQLAIVNLSEGTLDRLRYFLTVAKQDYRDVLFWSEHPEEAKIDTPEKKERIRKMFERFGLKPPESLSMSEAPEIGAMTVNERLNHSGLLGDFDAAIKARDKAAAIKVLTQARFSPEQAEYTASQVLKAPKRYGY